jgi:enterochelin esterase-like enzyme
MCARWIVAALVAVIVVGRVARAGAAELEAHDDVAGPDVTTLDVQRAGGPWQASAWDDLSSTAREPGRYALRFRIVLDHGAGAFRVPPCAGRRAVLVDGRDAGVAAVGPAVVPVGAGPRTVPVSVAVSVVVNVDVSAYERRIACGEPPRVGAVVHRTEGLGEGLGVLVFGSPYGARGGGRAVVYVPPGHDPRRPAPLLVGLHPWNGSIWTYAAYAELLREARLRDVVLLMPSGLGNSLYTADAEDEVMRAVDALSDRLAVDPRAVSLWGASMGGAGATTIGLHHPDRFAFVTSFFGDSKYDLATYVRSILPDEGAAHLVNAVDVADNARHVPVWLVHGEDDRTSPIRQSELLAAALRERGFRVRFDRRPGMGHAGALVARSIAEVVQIAATARVPEPVDRVTFRSVRSWDTGAYGVTLVRASPTGDALVDVARRDDAVHVLRAEGVRALVLARGALGTAPDRPPPIVVEVRGSRVAARWAEPAP